MCIRDRAHSDLPQFQGDDDRFPIYREPTDSPVAKPELYDAALVDQADDTYFMNHGYKDTLKAMPDNIFLMTTGSRQPTYFHSEHRQLPRCREVWPSPRIEMNPKDAERLGLKQGCLLYTSMRPRAVQHDTPHTIWHKAQTMMKTDQVYER